jgi:hypothetical protein
MESPRVVLTDLSVNGSHYLQDLDFVPLFGDFVVTITIAKPSRSPIAPPIGSEKRHRLGGFVTPHSADTLALSTCHRRGDRVG